MTEPDAYVRLACRCGQVQGRVARCTAGSGHAPVQTRVVCHCGDCQAFASWLGASGHALGANAGTDLVQMTPDRLHFDQGTDRLACIQLRDKGLLRWYASCCETPLCNTMARPFTAFVGVLTVNLQTPDLDTTFGTVQARAFVESAQGADRPMKNSGLPRVVFNFFRMILGSRVRGRHRTTPFFHADGTPVARPHLLSPPELEAVRSRAGIA